MHSSIQRDGHDKCHDSKFTKKAIEAQHVQNRMERKEELKPPKELGSWEGISQQVPGPKPRLNRWGNWGLKGWVICWGYPSTRGAHMGLEPRPLLTAPGSPSPVFQSLPLHCSNMLSLLAGKKKSNSMCWLKMKGKGTAMFYLQKPYWFLISKWIT